MKQGALNSCPDFASRSLKSLSFSSFPNTFSNNSAGLLKLFLMKIRLLESLKEPGIVDCS